MKHSRWGNSVSSIQQERGPEKRIPFPTQSRSFRSEHGSHFYGSVGLGGSWIWSTIKTLKIRTANSRDQQCLAVAPESWRVVQVWGVLKLLQTTWGLIECSWQLGSGWNCDSWILLAQVLRWANSFRHQCTNLYQFSCFVHSPGSIYGRDQRTNEGATFERLVHHWRCDWQFEAFADHRVSRRQDRFGRSPQHCADHPRTVSGMFLAICLSMLHSALDISILEGVLSFVCAF